MWTVFVWILLRKESEVLFACDVKHIPSLQTEMKNICQSIMSQATQQSLSFTFPSKNLANILKRLTKETLAWTKVEIYNSMRNVPDPVNNNFCRLSATNNEFTVTHWVLAGVSRIFRCSGQQDKLSMLLKNHLGNVQVMRESVEDDIWVSISFAYHWYLFRGNVDAVWTKL